MPDGSLARMKGQIVNLSIKEVEEIAQLARLDLTDDEKERFSGQLSAILDYFERMQALDTSDVPPTASVTGLVGVMREDEVRPSLSQAQALANAPAQEAGFVTVPAVLEES